uniref:Leucine-rich repeat-containing protein 15 n=2 Tax=Lygus hesperus TaxID=30085 RepID=A0A0A9VZD4_LYGHE
MILAFISFVLVLRGVSGDSLWCQLCDCSPAGVVNCRNAGLNQLSSLFNSSDSSNFSAIYLDDNSVREVPAFPENRLNLTVLSFRNNSIVRIANAAFRFVGGLKEIDLSFNLLASSTFKGEVFQGLYSSEGYEPLDIEVLNLGHNGLHTLDPDLFEHLPKLRVLSLDSNPLTMIDHPTLIALANIPLLEYLDLSRTQLRDIPPSMLHTSNHLHVLNISFNLFEDIPKALEATHELQDLVISGNIIQEIHSSPHVPSLVRLELSSMPKLRKIGSRGLGNFTNLKELVIYNNTHLFEIADDALVYEGEFNEKTWPEIKKLNISYNKLAWLDSEFIANWDKIEQFGFDENPWVCDCQNQWFLYELIPAIHKIQPEEAAKMKCQDPIEMRGISMLTLSKDGAEMRCLDKYGHHPENDGQVLFFLLIAMLFCVPIIVGSLMCYKRTYWRSFPSGPKCSYQRSGSLETIYHQ